MQETGARTILSEFLAVAISLAFSTTGFGQASLDSWPDDSFLENSTKREWPDGPNKEFLKNLMRPDNHKFLYRDKHSLSCCDAGDTVKTKFKVEGDGKHPEDRWYAWLDDNWVIVPPDKIRSRLRSRRTSLSFHARRHDSVLRAPEGRAVRALPPSRGRNRPRV